MMKKLDFFKMADNADQDKDKKRSNRTTKIIYYRCTVCGARKQETDMMNGSNLMNMQQQRRSSNPRGMCHECYLKQVRKSAGGVASKFLK